MDVNKLLLTKKNFPLDFAKIELFIFFLNQNLSIYVRFYLLYHSSNFGNKILSIL